MAVSRAALDELYGRLASAGFADLQPASAVVFQHVRPGGSSLGELARLGGMTPAAVEEQASALETAGYVVRRDDGDQALVDLTARGREAVSFGLGVLAEIEQQWRTALGDEAFEAFAYALARLNLA
jgi:DNA-binding MarR family transcriptional regulator